MNANQQHPNSPGENVSHVGLMAIGRSGDWEVSIDETISGADKWFAQIEGPSLYLYFEIASTTTIDELLTFLESPNSLSIEHRANMQVGTFNKTPVILLRDDEFPDRYFFCTDKEGTGALRFSVAGDNLEAILIAIRQVAEELKTDDD